jgi:hypothetical protein
VKAGAEAIGGDRTTAEAVLRAAMPLIERDVRRQMARTLLIETAERDLYDTFYLWRRFLKQASRTGLLPVTTPDHNPEEG